MRVNTQRTPVPAFKGKTAWELLDFITWIIQREPKRYDQGNWVQLVEQSGYHRTFVEGRLPSCGTIGCVAGWVDVLVTGRKTIVANDLFAHSTRARARKILGLTTAQEENLFDGEAVRLVRARLAVGASFAIGTPEYAEFGVLHIRRFMLAHERQLRRKTVREVK